jgi:hypothetical protein
MPGDLNLIIVQTKIVATHESIMAPPTITIVVQGRASSRHRQRSRDEAPVVHASSTRSTTLQIDHEARTIAGSGIL